MCQDQGQGARPRVDSSATSFPSRPSLPATQSDQRPPDLEQEAQADAGTYFVSKARTGLSAGSAKDKADKIFRSILERGLVKGTGVTKDKQIQSMDKLNISLLPIVSIYLLHPATSKLLLPLPNRLLVQLL